jgi:hypothetical protein
MLTIGACFSPTEETKRFVAQCALFSHDWGKIDEFARKRKPDSEPLTDFISRLISNLQLSHLEFFLQTSSTFRYLFFDESWHLGSFILINLSAKDRCPSWGCCSGTLGFFLLRPTLEICNFSRNEF